MGTLQEDVSKVKTVSAWILLRMKDVSAKCCTENQNTHFMISNLFFWNNVEKCGEARQSYSGRTIRDILLLLLLLLLFYWLLQPTLRVLASTVLRFRDHTQGHTAVGRTPLDEWSARRRDLYVTNTQHSQQTNIHALGGIRTRNSSRRAVADPRHRWSGHWDRLYGI
jgi:hypothetical protein